ncbi:unnamed protein product, partial [Pylaiella littoralis]
ISWSLRCVSVRYFLLHLVATVSLVLCVSISVAVAVAVADAVVVAVLWLWLWPGTSPWLPRLVASRTHVEPLYVLSSWCCNTAVFSAFQCGLAVACCRLQTAEYDANLSRRFTLGYSHYLLEYTPRITTRCEHKTACGTLDINTKLSNDQKCVLSP